MNANRQLGLTTRHLSKLSEKLSSGYKINRAADDAAGLSISEKMRKEIRGLNQASENIEDGISLCQVADGALNETVSVLQRMRELAIQSANGTNSVSDRQAIDMEITQLKREVDRIAETTNFNDAVYPLNSSIKQSSIVTDIITSPVVPPGNGSENPSGIILYEQTVSLKSNMSITYNNKYYSRGDTITITGMTTNGGEIRFDGGYVDTNQNEIWLFGGATVGYEIKKSDLKFDNNGYVYFDSKATNKKWYYAWKIDGSPDPIASGVESEISKMVQQRGYQYFTVNNLKNPPLVTPPAISIVKSTVVESFLYHGYDISVHAGASSSQANKIPIHIVNATCKGLGIADMTTVTEESSDRALDLLSDAIAKTSAYRSEFGAVQNRLEHAEKIDDNTAENTQAAESQICDTDMATEMVQYANTNILIQAGQSMLV